MPQLLIANLIKESTATTGTADLALDGAVDGFFAFDDIAQGGTYDVYVLIAWGTGAAAVQLVELGEITGSTLVRKRCLSASPALARNGAAGGLVSLPAGLKTVECVAPDFCQVAQAWDGTAGPMIPPSADGASALAIGRGASAYGAGAVVVGPDAYSLFADAVVVGNTHAPLADSATLALGTQHSLSEACLAGASSSGSPAVFDAFVLPLGAGDGHVIDVLAVAHVAGSYRVFRRSLILHGNTLVAQTADEVLTAGLTPAPTLTASIYNDGDDDWLRLSAASTNASAVSWKLFLSVRG